MKILFARSEHGGHRVVLQENNPKPRKLEIWWPSGPRIYKTRREAIVALVNGVPTPGPGMRDPNWSFDRYFRQGKYQRSPEPQGLDTLELFKPEEPPIFLTPRAIRGPGIGIDLAKRGSEVRKLFYAGFARRLFAGGFDPEDVLQELYKGLLIRNSGKCPWDPAKSSFGHYVHMVAGCIISNYVRRFGRLAQNEVFGVSDADGEAIDVSASDLARCEPQQENLLDAVNVRGELLGLVLQESSNRGIPVDMAKDVFNLMAEGAKGRELKTGFSHPHQKVAEAVKLVQDVAMLWKASQL